jgi:hypothetical protein
MHDQGHHPVQLHPDDVAAAYNIHSFLSDVNMGSGLAFLLHSTLSADKGELYVHDPMHHGFSDPRIGYHDGHVWATQPRMRRNRGMLFCSGHPGGRVAAHCAYPVDHTADDYVARESMEVRFLVKETRPLKDRIAPVPIRVSRRPGGPLYAPPLPPPPPPRQPFPEHKGQVPPPPPYFRV